MSNHPTPAAPALLLEELHLRAAQVARTLAVLFTALQVGAGYLRVDLATRRAPPALRAQRLATQHRRSAARLAALAARLRGLLIKSGQYLSARPDLLPEEYIEPLAHLQDAVPPHPARQIVRQIERELGRPLSAIFARFDRTAVASASLAQVHRARLHDGRDVAVKVLYPGIEGLVRADLRNLGLIVAIVARIWPRYDFRSLYREVARLVPAELDFHQEAQNCTRIGAELAGRADVLVPAVVPELSTRRVLTMSYVDGIRIGDVAALRAAGLNPPQLALKVVDIFGDQVIRCGFYHGDPHPGNILVLRDGRIGLLDFGQVLALSRVQREGFAALSLAALRHDPAAMLAAVGRLGIGLPNQSNPVEMAMAASALGNSGVAGRGDETDAAAVNVAMAHAFRNVSIDGVPGEVLCVFRVQGLLRGLRTHLGTPGGVILAWHEYAEALLAATPPPPSADAAGG